MAAVNVRGWLEGAHKAASHFDTWPVSPTQMGQAWQRRIRTKGRAHAGTGPPRGADGHLVASEFFQGSNEYSLTALTAHLAGAGQAAHPPVTQRVANTLAQAQASSATKAALDRYDKITRGWTLHDVGNLDVHLARQAGTQLMALARHTRTHPAGYTYEEWVQDLLTHGAALCAYADNHAKLTIEAERAHSEPDNPGAHDASAQDQVQHTAGPRTGWAEINARQAQLAQGAHAAWTWIAAHHTMLKE